jgi:hypothetical protein
MYDRSGIAQIALSTMDGQRSRDWYVRGLGYQPAGARQVRAGAPCASV